MCGMEPRERWSEGLIHGAHRDGNFSCPQSSWSVPKNYWETVFTMFVLLRFIVFAWNCDGLTVFDNLWFCCTIVLLIELVWHSSRGWHRKGVYATKAMVYADRSVHCNKIFKNLLLIYGAQFRGDVSSDCGIAAFLSTKQTAVMGKRTCGGCTIFKTLNFSTKMMKAKTTMDRKLRIKFTAPNGGTERTIQNNFTCNSLHRISG